MSRRFLRTTVNDFSRCSTSFTLRFPPEAISNHFKESGKVKTLWFPELPLAPKQSKPCCGALSSPVQQEKQKENLRFLKHLVQDFVCWGYEKLVYKTGTSGYWKEYTHSGVKEESKTIRVRKSWKEGVGFCCFACSK